MEELESDEGGAGRERGPVEVEAPVFEVRPLPEEGRLSVFRPHLAKYVEVFGLHVVATDSSPDAKVLHAATLLAEWLDNDEDEAEAAGSQGGGLADLRKVIENMAKLQMIHEWERRGSARDENFVMVLQQGCPLKEILEKGEVAYTKEGKDKRKEDGDAYQGHPQGKKPDALMALAFFRLTEWCGLEPQSSTIATALEQDSENGGRGDYPLQEAHLRGVAESIETIGLGIDSMLPGGIESMPSPIVSMLFSPPPIEFHR